MTELIVDTVRTDTFTMDYCRFGQGSRPFVILPGVSLQRVMGAASAIAGAYKPLADDYTCYVFERRNDMPPVYSIRDMARDTAAAMRALGLGPACVFGASQGGVIAMELAMEYPERVHRLVLGSTTARVTPAQRQMFKGWIRLAEAGDATALALAFGRAVYPPDVFDQAQAPLSEISRAVTREDLSRFIAVTRAMADMPDLLEDVKKITCPVLVIGSWTDQVLGGEASVQIAEQLKGRPDCELYMYDAYGHAAYDLAPDYTTRVREFLASSKP